jgi:hypothetical protein
MKKQLFLGCCAAVVLGGGCATYDSGGTADDTVVVSGSGYRDYYYEPYNYVDPHRDYFGRREVVPVWKQPPLDGSSWVDPRPEFLWYR